MIWLQFIGVLVAGFAVLSGLHYLYRHGIMSVKLFSIAVVVTTGAGAYLSAVVLGMPYENWQVGMFAFAAGCLLGLQGARVIIRLNRNAA